MTTEPQYGPSPGGRPLADDAGCRGAEPLRRRRRNSPPDGQPPLPPPAAPEQASPPVATALPQHRIKRTRTSGLWVAVGFFGVVLLLLLIFILQNGTQVSVSYLGLHGRLPLGVALLLSAVCGVLLVVLAGAARISQLRTVARRHRQSDAKRVAPTQATGEPPGPVR